MTPPYLVGELVDGQLPGDGHGLGDGLDEVVVAVGDGHVLVDVARVQHVVARRRDRHLDTVGVLSGPDRSMPGIVVEFI